VRPHPKSRPVGSSGQGCRSSRSYRRRRHARLGLRASATNGRASDTELSSDPTWCCRARSWSSHQRLGVRGLRGSCPEADRAPQLRQARQGPDHRRRGRRTPRHEGQRTRRRPPRTAHLSPPVEASILRTRREHDADADALMLTTSPGRPQPSGAAGRTPPPPPPPPPPPSSSSSCFAGTKHASPATTRLDAGIRPLPRWIRALDRSRRRGPRPRGAGSSPNGWPRGAPCVRLGFATWKSPNQRSLRSIDRRQCSRPAHGRRSNGTSSSWSWTN